MGLWDPTPTVEEQSWTARRGMGGARIRPSRDAKKYVPPTIPVLGSTLQHARVKNVKRKLTSAISRDMGVT
jgi:hypothetical protein